MSEPQKKLGRRSFLRTTAIVAGGGVLTVAGASVAIAATQPKIDFVNTSFGKEQASAKKILVAYASKCGSTGEIAQAIGEELAKTGLVVDVRPVQAVKDLSAYQALVLGGASRMGKMLAEAGQFAERQRTALSALPTAYFSVGTTMIHDTPENRVQASSYLDPLCAVKSPVSKGLFAGKVDHTKMEFPFGLMLSLAKPGDDMADGDHRDWAAIRAWANEIAPRLIAS